MLQNTNRENALADLFAAFSAVHPLCEKLRQAIAQKAKVMELPRKTSLLCAGGVADSVYFIIRGAVRIFYLNRAGEETNTWFLFENELAISVYSFFTGKPSFEYIETLEDCTMIVLKKQSLDWLYENFVEFNIIGRKFTEQYYIRNEAQANTLRMLDAKGRYLHLMETQPHVLQRVALGHIASYLGMTAETLSRIRKRI